MATGNVTLSLPQIVDIALNFPEHGAVNFNMLHTLLHVVLQQLQLGQCQVEFRGKDGERIQNLMAAKRDSTIRITEYVISPAKDAGKVVQRKSPKRSEDEGKDEGVLDMSKVGSKESLQTVVVVEQSAAKPEELYEPCIISKKNIDELNKDVGELKQKLQELAELPGNAALIGALRGAGIDKATPVLDMFQTMTLSKKIDAAETGIAKLASIVEDLARQSGAAGFENLLLSEGESTPGSIGEAVRQLSARLNAVETYIESVGGDGVLSVSGGAGTKSGSDGTDRSKAASGKEAKGSKGGSDGVPSIDGKSDGSGVGGGSKAGSDVVPGSEYSVDLSIPNFANMSQEEFADAIQKELKKIKLEIKLVYDKVSMLFNMSEEFTPSEISDAIKNVIRKHKNIQSGGEIDTSDLPTGERLEQLEDRFHGTNEQIASLDSAMNHEINNLHSQFAEMEKAFGNIMEKIHFGFPAGDSPGSGETLGELLEKLMGLQSDMENLAETASKLVEDKEDKQRILEVLTEQIEFLKTVKADKEDLEDALADKADACAINRKVSHDQFDTACDELSRGIEEALGKLTQQEELWQQALDEIQKEIGNKLDRMELGPLRDFVNNKLKMLQQRLKALTALKKEAEAAGTKKFLRNVNCISCDKDVVMRKEMDPSLLPQPYAMPPSRNMGPYLAYELDALRKQQKSLPNSRNLNHFESAIHTKSPRTGDDHICNRYCGGSHTITTPQQRVTRLGHFLNQWGPEAQAVSEVKEKEKEIAVAGHPPPIQQPPQPEAPMSPTISKIPSAESPKEQRKSAAGRPSTTGEKKLSKISLQKAAGAALSPKPSEEAAGKRTSQSSLKRPSGSKTGATQQEPSTQRISEQIPEETLSEMEKENTEDPPTSPAGDETDASSKRVSQADDAAGSQRQSTVGEPPKEGSQVMQKRASQASARQSGQISARPSIPRASKPSSQMSARGSTQIAAKPPEETEAPPPEE